MMFKNCMLAFGIIIFLSSTIWGSITSNEIQKKSKQAEEISQQGVVKISDDLYVGKAGEDFYLAMERVGHENENMWRSYATAQRIAVYKMTLKHLPTADGSGNFELVLNEYNSGKIMPSNEIWIAYASSIPVTKKAKLNNGKNPTVEMYLTVATSPNALLTSHMGISRTWEAALDLQQEPPKRKKHADQSIHLHSFAAKVMKMLDPKKVYMLTPPAPAMRDILIAKMPKNSVFIGDSSYKAEIEAIEKDPKNLLDEFDLPVRKGETEQDREERLKKAINYKFKFYNISEKSALLKSNPPRIIKNIKNKKPEFTILYPDEKPLITFDETNSAYQWLFTDAYRDSMRLPYALIDLDKLANATKLIA